MKPTGIYIAIRCADDSVAIMQFVTGYENSDVWSREATPEAIEAEIAKTIFPESQAPIKSWRIIDASEVPTDRTFRAAWRDREGIEVDMSKARDIHRDRLRIAREPMLAALDIEYQRADEDKDEAAKARVVARKKVLRDITQHPDIAKAKTPEELKLIWFPADT